MINHNLSLLFVIIFWLSTFLKNICALAFEQIRSRVEEDGKLGCSMGTGKTKKERRHSAAKAARFWPVFRFYGAQSQ
jgi:hypothetical protein